MTSRDIWVAIIVFGGWMVSLCLHEFGHAVVAYWGGDTSVKGKGYLSLNPLNYTHPLLSLGLPIVFLLIGGIPLLGSAVYVDKQRLRGRLWHSLVSAAGPLVSLLTAMVLALPFRLGWADLGFFPASYRSLFDQINPLQWAERVNPDSFLSGVVFPALALLLVLELYATLLNLLPIPPLDGYGIIEPWLPLSLQHKVRNGGIPWLLVLFGILWFVPPLRFALLTMITLLAAWLGVSPAWAMSGYIAFNTRPIALLFGLFVLLLLVPYLGRHLRRPIDVVVNCLDLLGGLFLQLRQYSVALACYQRAVRLNPRTHGGIWGQLGMVLRQLHRHQEAIAAFDRGLAIDPYYSKPAFNQGSYQLWLGRGLSLMDLHRYGEALESFQKSVEQRPEFQHGMTLQIWALQKLGRSPEALEQCDRLLNRSPSSSSSQYPQQTSHQQLLLLKGNILMDLNRVEAALAMFEAYCEAQSQSSAGWHERGVALENLNRFDEALDCYKTALQRSPRFRMSWLRRGWLLFRLKRYDAVLKVCRQSRRWLSQDPGMLNIKGATLTRLQRYDEALAAYDRAIQIQPHLADSWYNRSCYYAEVGDVEGAIANLRHAIGLQPQFACEAQSDESFASIRYHREFQALCSGSKSTAPESATPKKHSPSESTQPEDK